MFTFIFLLRTTTDLPFVAKWRDSNTGIWEMHQRELYCGQEGGVGGRRCPHLELQIRHERSNSDLRCGKQRVFQRRQLDL
jgi:hypothetical protein